MTQWGIEAADALDHAHSLGIVHRDIKPGNLLIDSAGKLWVTDFGLARLPTDEALTMTGDLLGTLRYMSPEQALARHGLVDHRTDIYSLGATLYELLAGHTAVEGADRQQILAALAEGKVVPPRKWEPRIEIDLETIVLKALASDPAERYASAKEFGADLKRYSKQQPISARRPSTLDKATKWSKRNTRALLAGTGISGVISTALAVALFIAVTSRHEAEVAKNKAEHIADREAAQFREALVAFDRLQEESTNWAWLDPDDVRVVKKTSDMEDAMLASFVTYYETLVKQAELEGQEFTLGVAKVRLGRALAKQGSKGYWRDDETGRRIERELRSGIDLIGRDRKNASDAKFADYEAAHGLLALVRHLKEPSKSGNGDVKLWKERERLCREALTLLSWSHIDRRSPKELRAVVHSVLNERADALHIGLQFHEALAVQGLAGPIFPESVTATKYSRRRGSVYRSVYAKDIDKSDDELAAFLLDEGRLRQALELEYVEVSRSRRVVNLTQTLDYIGNSGQVVGAYLHRASILRQRLRETVTAESLTALDSAPIAGQASGCWRVARLNDRMVEVAKLLESVGRHDEAGTCYEIVFDVAMKLLPIVRPHISHEHSEEPSADVKMMEDMLNDCCSAVILLVRHLMTRDQRRAMQTLAIVRDEMLDFLPRTWSWTQKRKYESTGVAPLPGYGMANYASTAMLEGALGDFTRSRAHWKVIFECHYERWGVDKYGTIHPLVLATIQSANEDCDRRLHEACSQLLDRYPSPYRYSDLDGSLQRLTETLAKDRIEEGTPPGEQRAYIDSYWRRLYSQGAPVVNY